ncbi:MAG TPA: PorP/SprF family type IX secretion system membrane protein [Flavitalea sp.]|nr:PorP/SprF family type IX secretion system membrane protein [Flavitalea sp.]
MKKYSILILIMILAVKMQGQSYHFSQFYSTPILVNPASTGNYPGDIRISGNFRSQWAADNNPYLTTALSAEYRLLREELPTTSKFGVGMTFLNDVSLGNAVKVNGIGASVGYNIGLDAAGIHSLGAGIHGTFTNRRIDVSRLTFENQFGPGGFDPSLPIGENIGNTSNSFFDVNAGLMYNADYDKKGYFLGVSVFNSFQHPENILDEQYKMPMRYSIQAGGNFLVDPFTRVYLSGNTMSQAEVMETTIGGAVGRLLLEGTRDEIYLGLWYRIGDAFCPYVGYQLAGFRAGLTVDVTTSKVKTGSNIRNAIELSLVYSPWDVFEKSRSRPWY